MINQNNKRQPNHNQDISLSFGFFDRITNNIWIQALLSSLLGKVVLFSTNPQKCVFLPNQKHVLHLVWNAFVISIYSYKDSFESSPGGPKSWGKRLCILYIECS